VSGHSTYSRAAAELMTALTGDAFFPGGMGEFLAPQEDFLVFEKGPSTDVVLQWATYRDASDQCSLSRIWGGIHPPADDIPGRLMGIEIGVDAFRFGRRYFTGKLPPTAAANDAYAFLRNTQVTQAARGGLLPNDNGHNGQQLLVTPVANSAPQLGHVSIASDGAFTYVPIGDYLGSDSFQYQIRDEWGSTDIATVTVYSTENDDVDDDGLPNSWELAHGSTLRGLRPGGDEDQDGIPNSIEFEAGLDPKVANRSTLLVLHPGWNLVSVPSGLDSTIASLFADRVTACWRWDAENRHFVAAPGATPLLDTAGYWVFSPRLDYVDLRTPQ
jgi:hypothetical protein